MEKITTIGVDLAKSVFQVHAVDASGQVVVARTLRRRDMQSFFGRLPPCLIGLEACSSSHHWGRVLSQLGHDVRLIPPGSCQPKRFASLIGSVSVPYGQVRQPFSMVR